MADQIHCAGPGTRLALGDESPRVRLALASALQRVEAERRWDLARALAAHDEDVNDPHLPLMIWYGIEPLVQIDREAALRLAADAKIPLVRRFVVRRALDVEKPDVEEVVRAALHTPSDEVRLDFLHGMLDALEELGRRSVPPSWARLYRLSSASGNPSLRSIAARLATVFGDRQAIAELEATAGDEGLPADKRRDAFRALLKLDDAVTVSTLHELVTESPVLRGDAVRALALRNNVETARVLLQQYPELEPAERQDVIGVLGTRRDFAAALLSAIEEGPVDRADVSVFALQQLRRYDDAELESRITTLWTDDASRLETSDQLARYRRRMSPEYLKTGDAHAGRLLFEKTCARCHVLFGAGSDVGPDLTGSGRRDIDHLLSNLIDPSATIDPAYRLTTVLTKRGQVFSGFIVYQDDRFVELRTQEAPVRLSLDDVTALETSSTSMMPEGLLNDFSDEQVRDLLLYLASPRQVERRRTGP